MRALRRRLDRARPHFEAGGRLESLGPLYEMVDTLLYTPDSVTTGSCHVRDASDFKRIMLVVVVALMPCIAMALYNTGLQSHLVIAAAGAPLPGWRTELFDAIGLGYSPQDVLACTVHGALYFVPVLVVGFAAGGAAEVVFAIVRKRQVNEGFFVTGFLYPLILPATLPLWQVALSIVFGVIIGKEIFGGTGMNILNPALTARAFAFFGYPAQMSGDVWVAAERAGGTSGATSLARFAESGLGLSETTWNEAFWGLMPGSMGETSAALCLIGAAILIATQVASWRTMLGVAIGTAAMASLLNLVGSDSNPMMSLPFHWHMVVGGWAIGAVFMATDPVTSASTENGRLVYGLCIGVLVVLIRCVNPAYPEGMMLAILLMNIFAPLIDAVVVRMNVRRRQRRYAEGG